MYIAKEPEIKTYLSSKVHDSVYLVIPHEMGDLKTNTQS